MRTAKLNWLERSKAFQTFWRENCTYQLCPISFAQKASSVKVVCVLSTIRYPMSLHVTTSLGIRKRRPRCVRVIDGQLVSNSRCDQSTRPSTVTEDCNISCQLRWVAQLYTKACVTTVTLASENSLHFTTSPLVSPRNDVWEMSAEIPYW